MVSYYWAAPSNNSYLIRGLWPLIIVNPVVGALRPLQLNLVIGAPGTYNVTIIMGRSPIIKGRRGAAGPVTKHWAAGPMRR